MSIIQDGTGSGNRVRVSGNRLFAHSISEGQALHSSLEGDGYNINTGLIGLTSGTASGVLYIKNNETLDLVIESVVVGIGTGTVSDTPAVTIVRNPTGGTLISGASAVSMFQNRNFGSSKLASLTAYKGAEGNTVTGGDNTAMFYASTNNRHAVPLDLIVPRGSSIAVTIDANVSTGTVQVYAAAICYLISTDYLNLR